MIKGGYKFLAIATVVVFLILLAAAISSNYISKTNNPTPGTAESMLKVVTGFVPSMGGDSDDEDAAGSSKQGGGICACCCCCCCRTGPSLFGGAAGEKAMAKERERKAKLAKEKRAQKRKHKQHAHEQREQRERELRDAASAPVDSSSDSEFGDDDGDPGAAAQRHEERRQRREADRQSKLPDRTLSFNLTLTVSESDWLQANDDLERLCEFAQGDGRGRITAPCIELVLLDAAKKLDNNSWEELEQAAAIDPTVMLVDDPLDGNTSGAPELPDSSDVLLENLEIVEMDEPEKKRRRAGRLQRKLDGLQRKRATILAEQTPKEPQLSKADLQEKARVEAVWNAVDIDGSGFLDEDEVRTVMQDMGIDLEQHQFASAMQEIDKDGSGELDFKEFLAWWERQDPEAQKQLQILHDLHVDEL
eukprot:COSAG05_NODE_1961_length_3777_cov_28.309407_3_plen_419_part_00